MVASNLKGKKLVIVESPTKQKTISKILGNDFIVRSSFGHVRDLPSKSIGVDIAHDFQPTYVPVERAKRLIAELTSLSKNANEIFLATDPDREGEAIAWHLVELLKIPSEKYKRIFFHEITPSAIKESFSNARKIDTNLVNAQQARRILDRLVGYLLSPLLWKKITSGLSAGRVQSVAVRLLAERAKEIKEFKEQEYWTLGAKFEKENSKPSFLARISKYNGKSIDKTTTYHLFAEDYKVKTTPFDSPEKLASISEVIRKGPNKVSSIEKKEVKQHPKPPFITSSMQQDAYNKLGFSSQKTMMTAQSLYEGVEIAGQTVGLITYMRTDSFNVSSLLQGQTAKFIMETYGKEFSPTKPQVYKSKVMGAQEAHESIHPTDVRRTPEKMRQYLSSDQYKLYELIWLRFVASQMADAIFNTVVVDITSGEDGKIILRANGRTVKFKGYLSVYEAPEEDKTDDENEGNNLLPALEEGDSLKLLDLLTKEHKTTPPPCYNEASLIKALEKHGIGRPSTYATIIKTILDRKYVAKPPKTNKLVATDLGITVTESLKEFFKEIMDLSYTADIEEKLDEVAEGSQAWVDVLSNFNQQFQQELNLADKSMSRPTATETEEKCPVCGKNMLKKRSRFGEYLVCQDSTCKGKINLTKDGEKITPEKTNEVCEKCGSPMVIRTGRRGRFLACSAYPKCKNTISIDDEGNKLASKKSIVTNRFCEKCGKPLVLRNSKRGEFLGCSGYPKCKNIVTVTPEEIAAIKKEAEKEEAK